MMCMLMMYISFNICNTGSVGQGAAKLQAVKVRGLKKVCHFSHYSQNVHAARVCVKPGSNRFQSPLTNRPHNTRIKRSEPHLKGCQKLRMLIVFLGYVVLYQSILFIIVFTY